jgi:hypothetical protein
MVVLVRKKSEQERTGDAIIEVSILGTVDD